MRANNAWEKLQIHDHTPLIVPHSSYIIPSYFVHCTLYFTPHFAYLGLPTLYHVPNSCKIHIIVATFYFAFAGIFAMCTYLRYRSPSTHNMSPLVRKLFLHFMPKLMMMRRTQYTLPDYDDSTPSNGYTNEIDVR